MPTVTPRGTSFLAQARVKKQGVIIFSESRTFDDETVARNWAKNLEDEVKKNGASATANRTLTVGELILMHLKYMKSFKEPGRSLIQNYEYMATQFRDVKLGELKARDIIRFATGRRAEGVVGATIIGNLSALTSAIHAAPFAHGIEVSPAETDAAIAKLREDGVTGRSRQVIRVIDAEEEVALMAELRRHSGHQGSKINMPQVMAFALAFPRRASELTRIRWSDVDAKRRTVIIRDVKHPRLKKGNDQVVPLLGDAWTLLQQMPRLDERILPYNTESVLAAFQRARDRIAQTGMPGIKNLRFHDLRHSGITRLFEMGLSVAEVAVVSGHGRNWGMLARYTHIKPESLHRHFPEAKAA